MRILPRPRSAAQVRAVIEEQGPRAEEMAARYVERTRPVWSWLAVEWRRLATIAVLVMTMGLIVHTMFGANGVVVYQQKRGDRQDLQLEVNRVQKENDELVARINALKTDEHAIEKEAREQLHYTRQGEVIFVGPEPVARPPVGRAKNGK